MEGSFHHGRTVYGCLISILNLNWENGVTRSLVKRQTRNEMCTKVNTKAEDDLADQPKPYSRTV